MIRIVPKLKSEDPEKAICQNLSYSLDKLSLNKDANIYRNILESVLEGPFDLKCSDVKECLGVDCDMFWKRKEVGSHAKSGFGVLNEKREKINRQSYRS